MVVRSLVPNGDVPAPNDLIDLVTDVGGGPEPIDKWAQLGGRLGAVRRALRFTRPIEYDLLRQARTDYEQRKATAKPLPRRQGVPLTRAVTTPVRGTTPAVLFALHWLELGGAERWALDTIQLAKEAGLVPIVITDRASPHPWITRPELAGAVVVPMTHPITLGHDSALLNGIFAAYDVRGIHVHHNTWMYDRLPWIKSVRPDIPVVDSLHILEWRTGGFVDHSVIMSDLIDVHHVISPHLRDYLTGKHGIAADKVALSTLANLTTTDFPRAVDREDKGSGRFTVTYVARYHQQKRPYLFLKLAAELKKAGGDRFRFIMHGDGELAREVHSLRARYGLTDVLELRGTDKPVPATLAESDVMVITSENEGLSLTSFEATAAGVTVVSTDVGSQSSIVAKDLLCPRHPYPFISAAVRSITEMASSPDRHKRWFDEQVEKAEALKRLPHAKEWAQETYRKWSKS
ncbi:glycosyltransferase [Amycolatopsis sp. RM579]|uniref:Glycosyltransferase n=1 Tax=Amycolatopsis pithecellobii TaxID=664692 RepID=A0A6N7Z6Y5_9PSEU|nr:glycosyltransferase [Amycolatopsis pithecellobii]